MSAKFYICRHCGNLVGMIHDAGVPMMCCGQKMEALEPNTVEASGEKHLPAVTVEDGAIHVNVGSVDTLDRFYLSNHSWQTGSCGQAKCHTAFWHRQKYSRTSRS